MPNIISADEIRVPRDNEDQDELAAVQAAREEAAKKQADQDRKQAVLNIQARRDERLYQKAIQGQSISEQNKDVEESSAADWINKLMAQGSVKSVATPQKRQRQDAAAVNGPDLRIRHDADDIAEGETIILTLKDRRIGDVDDEDAEGDELENIQLVEQRKLERNLDRKAKRRRKNEEEEQEDEPQRTVLEKYDEIKEELDAKKGGMILTSSGSVIDRAAQIRAKLAAPLATNKIRYDFGSSSSKLQAGDFYIKEEVALFKKPGTKKTKKRNSVRRKIIPEELDLPPGPSVDHGSRDTSRASIKARIEANSAEMKLKRQRFDIAVAKSDAKSLTLLDNQYVFEDDAEDLQLQEALAKANRAARHAQEMQQKNGARPTPKKSQPTAKISALSPEELESEGIVFSTASEFMTNVRVNAIESKPIVGKETKPEENVIVKQEVAIDESYEDDMEMEPDEVLAETVKKEKEEPLEEEELSFMNDVIDNGKGVSGALKLIRSRGLASAKALPPATAGRARDTMTEEHKDPAPHLRLDRVDEFGRPMTMKEAFRELSYRFHGHRPGAKKTEKKLKELQQQLKLQESISGRTVTSTQRLADVSAKAGRHYVVMDSKTGAFGKVMTQKLAIGIDDTETGAQQPDHDERAYVAGSKKVEFAIGKSE